MGNMKRGLLISLAAVVLSTMVLSGCSGQNDPAENAGSSESTAPASSGPVNSSAAAEQPMAIDWMQFPSENLKEDSLNKKWLEDKFNVKLSIYPIAYKDYPQKQQLTLASGQIPDVMYTSNPGDVNKFASQGLLAEIPIGTIEKYAPRTKANIDKQAPQGWFYSNVNGQNFGVPTFYFTGQFHTKQAWRVDLLEKTGITELPETLDQFTAAFSALKKIDVYGMSSNGNSFYNAFHSIFGAYGIEPTQWMLKDGKVVNGATQPETKEALALLADWYKAGYIDPDFVTGKDYGQKFVAGQYAFMDAANVRDDDAGDPNSALAAALKVEANAKVAFGPLPKGPNGASGGWSWGTAGHIWVFGKQLENDPAKLQKALEMIDEMQNGEETWMQLAWGQQGVHWDYKDAALGAEGGLKRLPPYDTDFAKLQAEGIADAVNGTTFWGDQGNLDLVGKFYGKATVDKLKLHTNAISDLFGKSDILPSSGKYWGDLLKLKTEAYAAIIRGDQPIDYFDEFVRKWNDMGGAQLETEANQVYASVKK